MYFFLHLSLKEAIKSDESESENDDSFLQKKPKSSEEQAKEEADYIEWLKGKKKRVKDPDLAKNMKTLHDYWNDPKLNEGERFLRDYILNKKYLSKDDDDDDEEDDDDDEDKNGDADAKKDSEKVTKNTAKDTGLGNANKKLF